MLFLTAKWIHIVAVISWMAGILYLYRILIYHAEAGYNDEKVHDLLVMQASKLYRIITMPAMLVSVIAGFVIVGANPGIAKGGWFASKFILALLLMGTTGYAKKLMRGFAAKDQGMPSGKKLRFLNEVPTILMIIIVGLVVFKPF